MILGARDGMVTAACQACPWEIDGQTNKQQAFGSWFDHDCDESGRLAALVGIDPSLTATGVVQVGDVHAVETIKSAALPKGERNVHDHSARIERTASAIANAVPMGALVAIEGPALRAKRGNPDERAGLRWSIIARLRARGCLVVQVPPKSAKIWLAGNGNADKEAMTAAAKAAAPESLRIKTEHEADAFAMLAMLAEWVGRPVMALPPRHDQAIKGVAWAPIERKQD